MARNGFVLTIVSLVLLSLAASGSNAQTPADCPLKCPTCPDISQMVPIQAYGTVIFFDPVGRAYYYQGKKYAVLNERNEAVLVPADAPPAETLPPGGQATPQTQTPAGQQPGGGIAQTLGIGTAPPAGGQPAGNGNQPAAGATQPAPVGTAPVGTAPVGTAPQAGATPQAAAPATVAELASSRSATLAPLAPSVLESTRSDQAKPQAQPELGRGATNAPIGNLVAFKTPLANEAVNVASPTELAKLNGRWRASVRDFLGNTTVIEMELQDLAGDSQATLISQTTGQPPSESKRKIAFTDNKLTLTDGTDAQVLGQIAEISTVRLRITGAGGEMLFTRSPAD